MKIEKSLDYVKSYCIAIVLIALYSCDSNPKLKFYQDPYLDSFRGRGVKQMICLNPEDSTMADTVTFDDTGNIVQLKEFGLNEKRSYDSLLFIKRILRVNDIPSNYFIKYHFNNKGKLIQEWNAIKHLNWSFKNSDIEKLERVVEFEIDDDGRVIKELDTLANQNISYIYGKDGFLLSKQVFSIAPKDLLYEWIYSYKEPGRLNKIALKGNDQEFVVHYYTNGLLDSTFDKGHTTQYKYVFY